MEDVKPTITEYSNRTHPMFQGQNCLNTLNLGITTRCSMKCPNCTVNVPGIKALGQERDAMMAEVFHSAYHMRPLRRVHVTGGEPTLHRFFPSIVGHLKEWFDCKYLTLETNGYGYIKYRELIAGIFDLVFITHYEPGAVYEGSPGNTDIIVQAQKDLGNMLIVEEPVKHLPAHITIQEHLTIRDYKKPKVEDVCSKFSNPGLPAGWYNNRLYKCCVTFGLDASVGIKVDKDWRENIVRAEMGCNLCSFRGT